MAAPYDAILPRKLKELEFDLTQMFHSSPPTITDGDAAGQAEGGADTTTAASLHSNVVRRFEFLKNLFSLEMESHPGDTKPEHLHHMADHLSFLEDAYHKWALFGTSPFEQTLDSVSLCSCTSSCFDAGDDEEWMELPYAKPSLAEGQPTEPIAPNVVKGDIRGNEESHPAQRRKKAWTVGATALLAAVAAGLVLTSVWVTEDEQQFLLVPT